MKKATMKQYEKSAQNRAMDKKYGMKEGSPREKKMDKAALSKINRKK